MISIDMIWRDHIFQYTPCSLGSELGNMILGTVYLDTLPGANIRNTSLHGKHWQYSSNDANRHNVDIRQHPTSSLFLKTRSMSKFSSLTDWEQHVPHGRPLRPRLGRNSSEVLPHPAARRAEEKPVDLQSKVRSSLMSLSISPFPGNSTLLMLKSTKITTKLFNNMTLHWSNPVSF